MKRIKILDKGISEMIAAGEVVERPASVVKELMENSVDAGASSITVEIRNGGISLIKVSDDGCGIYKDDVKAAFLRHSTSKIQNVSDLDSISTLGFRGEALCSICAVSRVELITAREDENFGVRYLIEGGEEKLFEEAGRARGTTFTVRDLFFNTPARMKFLKKDVSEANAVADIVDKIALSHPEISVKFIRDGKLTVNTQGDGKLSSCIYSIYGKDVFDIMIPVDYKLNGISISGFINKPGNARASRTLQNFFINHRFAKIKLASVALEDAFKGFIMIGKHPICVLYIDIPYGAVDVNVHPAKTEVRFVNEKMIFEAIYYGVKSALMKDTEKKEMEFEVKTKEKDKEENKNNEKEKNEENQVGESINEFKKESDEKIGEKNRENFGKTKEIKREFLDDYVNNKNKTSGKEKNTIFMENNTNPQLDFLSLDSHFDMRLNDCMENSFKISVQKEKEDFNINKENLKEQGRIEKNEIKENKIEKISNEKRSEIEVLDSLNFYNNIEKKEEKEEKEKNTYSDLCLDNCLKDSNYPTKRLLGEVFNCYILLQEDDKLIFIDKHAAHERILYNKLKSCETEDKKGDNIKDKEIMDEKKEVPSQGLLKPIIVSLDKESYSGIIENLDLMKKSGYIIEDFGNGSVIVRGAPVYLDISEIEDSVIEIAEYLTENKMSIDTKYLDWLYHNIACRAAIKAGKSSSEEEIRRLLNELEEKPEVMYCPHGRPIYIELKKKGIEKQFGRNG